MAAHECRFLAKQRPGNLDEPSCWHMPATSKHGLYQRKGMERLWPCKPSVQTCNEQLQRPPMTDLRQMAQFIKKQHILRYK
eukprot:1273879-Amphidinium_carterae.1